jgi:desulfoferrodoxin
MARMKGQILECDPCGREVTVSKEGVSHITVYCCGLPMKHKTRASTKKKTTRKTTAKKEPKNRNRFYGVF